MIDLDEKVRLLNGLGVAELAGACSRLYVRVVTGEAAESMIPTAGWASVAEYVARMFLATEDDDLTVSFAELAAVLRKQYARGEEAVGEETPWEEVPPLQRLAWESVARLASWAVQSHEALNELGAAEDYRGDWAEAERERRSITRE